MPNQPVAPRLPPLPIPENNLDSVVNSLKIMRQHLLAMGGQTPTAYQQTADPLGQPSATNRPTRPRRWTELQRETEQTALVNPDDDNMFIVFPRTAKLVLHDAMTGEQWTYRHKAKNGGSKSG